MKKNKLLYSLILLVVVITFTLNSCSKEEYDEPISASIPENQISTGVEITEDIATEVALNFYNRTYKSSDYLLRKGKQTEATVSSTKAIKDFNNQTGIYIVNIEPSGLF